MSRWLTRAGIAPETVNARVFVDGLIVPAYQQGLARWLAEGGVDLKLFGRGWDQVEGLAARHAGGVVDRAALGAAAEACGALVHVWPRGGAHPIEALGRPVLRRSFKGREMWLAEAKRLARGEGRCGGDDVPALSADVLRNVIGLPSPA